MSNVVIVKKNILLENFTLSKFGSYGVYDFGATIRRATVARSDVTNGAIVGLAFNYFFKLLVFSEM